MDHNNFHRNILLIYEMVEINEIRGRSYKPLKLIWCRGKYMANDISLNTSSKIKISYAY